MADLSRIGERERLKPNRGDEPHWQRLRAGCYLGYRPSRKGGKGTWFARAYDAEKLKYSRKALGDYGALAGHDVFTAARKDAEAWADLVETGGVRPRDLVTVADACRTYLETKPGAIAAGVFRRHVYSDPIAKVKLDKLRKHHLQAWRQRLVDAPALISRTKAGEKRTKRRAASTINRDMVPLRAALTRVLAKGTPGTEAAWQDALRPIKKAGSRRLQYLDRQQRAQLVDAADRTAQPFLRAMCLLPLRPGPVAALRVRDFEERTRTLHVGNDKNGEPRLIGVPAVTANFLKAQSKGKGPNELVFTREDSKPWCRNTWKGPIKHAAKAAGLSTEPTAYTFRHSVITDLVIGGVPLLTIAQLAGTSVEMIQKYYGHLLRDAAEAALAKLAL